jgi:hypothetical protein
MFDLIYTQKENATALDFNTIIDDCPAVLTETKSPETSGKYGFVNTMQAMQILGDYGFRPTKAMQQPSRNPAKKPFAMHMISFAHDDDLRNPYNETRPEIILYNSHDGKSALKLFAGAYRFICSNGIVAGDGFQSKMRHSKKTANGFETLLKDTAESLPRMMQRIATMQENVISTNDAIDFSYNAAALRWEMAPDWGDDINFGAHYDQRTIDQMQSPRRREDIGNNAWVVFNKIQESILRGGVEVRSITQKHLDNGNAFGQYRKAKAVCSLPETIRLNRELWDMSNAFA